MTRGRMKGGVTGALAATLLLAGCATAEMGGASAGGGADAGGSAAARRFQAVRTSPPELRAFLYRMPKGADLHSHLTGAAYAETYMRMAADAGLCFDVKAKTLVAPTAQAPCGDARSARPGAAAVIADSVLYPVALDALSTRDALPVSGYSLHDQFFATFGRFRAAATSTGDLLAEVVDRAGRQGERHVELMVSFGTGPAAAIGKAFAWTPQAAADLAGTADRLIAAGLPALVAPARQEIDAAEARMRSVLGCGTSAARPGCTVSVRYLQQVSRTQSPGPVYATTLFNALLEAQEPRVVGLNFVAPEDNPVALDDYDLHMRMVAEAKRRQPGTNVALHAGELTLGLVPPERLRDHIRKAVEIAGAKRIGHGVDVMYEEDPQGLLRTMAGRKVAVEINLTSNDKILGVSGKAHPLPVYRAAGVPVVLSTDDEGVSRIDLTNELQRAVEEFGFGYADLVGLARASLEHSFLPGDSLWSAPGCTPPVGDGMREDACRPVAARSEKARVQWGLEEALARFDREMAGTP
ncbi:adenosine deaminase [Azospirillum palustre]|uniref:adenosine deaminase n=1 Tax=Azospirillum palustre TaxID=2044885 RepID=A0A2B8B9V1_9PROT|nr:adenosine deaminase [Azospirillum palustre]PGH54725.1 adenosine deaminase [Azospirillum palustre]